MKKLLKSLLLLLVITVPLGCTDMDDDPVPAGLQINDFIWKGMNTYYLWQADVPDLADSKDDNQEAYYSFLESYPDHAEFFNHLRVANTIDRFSVIYSDYTVLEGVLSGTTLNNGMDFGFRLKPGSQTDVFGWVHYVLPNSDAAAKGISRGAIFYAIDGVPLTVDNFRALIANTTYTISLANYDGGNITPTGESVTLTKTNLSENPIYLNTVITEGTHKIGYLMYNGFYSAYDSQLNAAFGNMKSQGVTDLVLDLRYNSGGAISTAVKLASMITGQFTGQLFAKQQWNAKAQAYYESASPGSLQNKFIGGLNSLNLNKVYILTTNGTASASELVINCLKPYITVVQIGDTTIGKNVGSVTLYDSPNFISKSHINPNHKYAMQPIVLKIVNKLGLGDYTSGIAPTTPLSENLGNLSSLGNPDELYLSEAINQIIASGKQAPLNTVMERDFIDSKSINPLRTEMYLERL